jgi:hypothetical protein
MQEESIHAIEKNMNEEWIVKGKCDKLMNS